MKQLELGTYQHYKGAYYEVIGVAKHSETLEDLVVYRAKYDSEEFGNNALWVRPLSMFKETIMINGERINRFRFVDNS